VAHIRPLKKNWWSFLHRDVIRRDDQAITLFADDDFRASQIELAALFERERQQFESAGSP